MLSLERPPRAHPGKKDHFTAEADARDRLSNLSRVERHRAIRTARRGRGPSDNPVEHNVDLSIRSERIQWEDRHDPRPVARYAITVLILRRELFRSRRLASGGHPMLC